MNYARSICLILGVALLSGCATTSTDAGQLIAYAVEDDPYAPVFLVERAEKNFNRIGTPSAEADGDHTEVYVDSTHPTVYVQRKFFEGDRGTYLNTIYRVHFEKSPFTLVPFNASAGDNVGFIAVVTTNDQHEPLFLTTVQSCGCYHAITPTSLLDGAVYPEGWSDMPVAVYGETLAGRLDVPSDADTSARFVVRIRSGTHRAMEVAVADLDSIRSKYAVELLDVLPIEALKALPIEGRDDTASFYYTSGPKKGLVKGARKPLETLLFGPWVGDAYVGQDREYGPKDETGKLFYTTLSRKGKEASDMWDFAGFLRHNGWRP